MTKLNQIYKCRVCGNIVEVVHGENGELTCCENSMILMEGNTQEASVEKHIPVVKIADDNVHVVVGEVFHPMDDNHYIEWIEVVTDEEVYRKYLKPGNLPEAKFDISTKIVSVRAYCNLHGLWKKD